MLCFLFPLSVNARSGCCSNNGGVCGCSKYGQIVCCDNKLSKTCRCNAPEVYGCTDKSADNYNDNANKDDGSCIYNEESEQKKKNENKYVAFVVGLFIFFAILTTPSIKK